MKALVAAKIQKLDALTGLRGVAALWVVAMHFSHEVYLLLPITAALNWLIGQGANAVPLFFILSGFILLHTYRERFEVFSWTKYFGFIWLRLARIYPAYLAALGLMVSLVLMSIFAGVPYSKEAYPLARLPWEALMLHRWWWTDFFGWNFPDWSISAEWFAYLFIFPLAVWLLKKLESRSIGFTIVALLGLLMLEPLIRTEWKLPMVSLLFLAGALVWEMRRRLPVLGETRWPKSDLVAALFLMLALWLGQNLGSFASAALFLVAVAWLIFSLSQTSGLAAKFLAWGPVLFMGEISYSIYLTHGLCQRVLKVALSAEKFTAASFAVRIAVLLAYGLCLLALALALYFSVERPARRWLRRLKAPLESIS